MVDQLQPSVRQTTKTTAKVYKKPEETLIGQEISGCIILEKVSEGGMGTVFKAKHKALDRIVCVKILSPALSEDKKAVGLFLTEARAIAEIDHPNIVFVYNVGREKGFYFIVMSFIEGESLSAIVRKRPNLPVSFIIETFIGILQGLEAAHQKGIIHRDIKPSNILINKKLEPKIVDFGIAKKVDKDKGNTKTTELAGTAYFLSPEQALGRPIDTRADLYSVGASLYYVLTAKYPFTGKNSMDIIQKHINEPVPDVLALRKNIPAWLGLAVSKLMSKNPDDRFQTATDTLNYFKKMRADDQLKVTGGVNITEEVGLKVNLRELGASPVAKPAAQNANNRFNMNVEGVSPSTTKPSVDVVSLGSRSEGGFAAEKDSKTKVVSGNEPDKTFTQKFIEQRRKQFTAAAAPADIDPTKALKVQKNKFLIKGFLYTLLAAFMMSGASALFMRLGALASEALKVTGLPLSKALTTPFMNTEFVSQNMILVSVAFVFIIFTVAMSFFDVIRKSVVTVLIIALCSYAAALFGFVDPQSTGFDFFARNSLPVYAIFFAALAINIDDSDYFPLMARFISVVLFILGFMCVYMFTQPAFFVTGALTASLSYAALGLVAATCVSVFMRGSFIYRFAAVSLFVIGCAAIWTYQASGNTYYTLKQIENYTEAHLPKAEVETPAAPEAELEPQAPTAMLPIVREYIQTAVQVNVLTKADEQPAQYEEDVTPEPAASQTAPEAEIKPEQPAQAAAANAQTEKEEKPVVKAPPLSPKEKRELLIKTLATQLNNKTKTAQLVENQVWGFALREPFEKLAYTYKNDNLAFMAIVLLIVYGIFSFIISVLVTREERWNLI